MTSCNRPLSSAHAIKLVSRPEGMNSEETQELLELLTSGTVEAPEGGELLKTWAKRGETGVELAATVRYLRQKAVSVNITRPSFDTCGTGGSGLTRYNISTTVAFVVAAAGIPVAKHGNRGSSRPNGSFDLLDALGIPFELNPAQEVEVQKETGLCFLFARTHHPIVGQVVAYRKAAACRSIFNMAGPIANPSPIGHQIIGTINRSTAKVVVEALSLLETDNALVVWGDPGIDEISVTGETGYFRLTPSGQEEGTLSSPQHPQLDYASLPGGDAQENAEIFTRLLQGEERGPLLDMLCVNAGAAIDLCSGRPPSTWGAGARLAQELIQAGTVWKTFEHHKNFALSLTR